MQKLKLSLIVSAALGSALTLSAQNVQTFVTYSLQQNWDPGNLVDSDAGDESLDTNTTNPGFFQSIYGNISGNTIDRATFKTAVSNAFLAGRGGVIDFEDANQTFSGVDYIDPNTSTTVARNNAADVLKGGNLITIERGPNWWFEGSAVTPYKGKQTAFDGTGPSGPDRLNFDQVFFFEDAANGIGGSRKMGLTTSYDLDFDPADLITTVGFALMNNYDNFQAQQDTSKAWAFYPNIHAIATFTDGSSTVTQMAVGLTNDVAGGDYYFGFEGPSGFYLDELDVYAIGNNDRVFIGIDDFGFVTAVPEPSTFALLAGLLGGLMVLSRRRSK